MPNKEDFTPLPSSFSKLNGLIALCGHRIDSRIGVRTIKSTGAVKFKGRYFLRYHPLYVTDTVYYFEFSNIRVLNAYKSSF